MKQCKKCPFLEYQAPTGRERKPYFCKVLKQRKFYDAYCQYEAPLINLTIELYRIQERKELIDYEELADFIQLYRQGDFEEWEMADGEIIAIPSDSTGHLKPIDPNGKDFAKRRRRAV